jgi:hypothetical protein
MCGVDDTPKWRLKRGLCPAVSFSVFQSSFQVGPNSMCVHAFLRCFMNLHFNCHIHSQYGLIIDKKKGISVNRSQSIDYNDIINFNFCKAIFCVRSD